MEPDNSVAMEAFRQRAMNRSPVPAPDAPEQGLPPTGIGASPEMAGGMPRGPLSQPRDEKGLLEQVKGKVTEPEMIQVLISRLKSLLPKGEGKQTASSTQ